MKIAKAIFSILIISGALFAGGYQLAEHNYDKQFQEGHTYFFSESNVNLDIWGDNITITYHEDNVRIIKEAEETKFTYDPPIYLSTNETYEIDNVTGYITKWVDPSANLTAVIHYYNGDALPGELGHKCIGFWTHTDNGTPIKWVSTDNKSLLGE